jgi:exonuclease III
MEFTDIYRIFHPAAAQYTFFSAVKRTFFKIDYIVGYKASFKKYKKIIITPVLYQTTKNKSRNQQQMIHC